MKRIIDKIYKVEEEDSPYVFVNTSLITRDKKNTFKFKRNTTVMVKNLDTGLTTFLVIKGKTGISKNTACISYDAAVNLGLDLSSTFRNTTKDLPVDSNLAISKPTLLRYWLNAFQASDRIVKASAFLSAVGIAHLFYSIIKDAAELIANIIQ